MSQINEGWASRTQEERDEMNKKEREQRILALSKKYGSKKVKQAQKEADDDNRRKGKSVKRNPASWKELQSRIENSKDRLKKGEVKKWDDEKGRWVSNKEEDVNEEAPPTEKHERMVMHVKKSYKKDGKLTDQEKSIAYATAWKNYNKEKTT